MSSTLRPIEFSNAFLSPSEIETLTGYRRKKEQREWLRHNGFSFVVNRLGCPIMSRNAMHERLSNSASNSPDAMPDLDALKELGNGSKKT